MPDAPVPAAPVVVPDPGQIPVVSPVQAALGTLTVEVGNAVVAFGAFSNVKAAAVETVVIGALGVGFLIANALHHASNVKAAVALHQG